MFKSCFQYSLTNSVEFDNDNGMHQFKSQDHTFMLKKKYTTCVYSYSFELFP